MNEMEQRVVKAIAADLEANAGLPPHLLVRYRRPRAILPADCPALVVWLVLMEQVARTTEWFDGTITVGISWHEEAVVEAQTLAENEGLSLRLIEALSLIRARLRVLSRTGLVDPATAEAWQVLPGAVQYLAPEAAQGLTEGYVLEATVDVVERS